MIFLCTWFPHRLESEDHARPWFCPKLMLFLCTWFPHRLESEDHARPWFCPKLMIFLCTWFSHRIESEDHARPWFYPKLFLFLFLFIFIFSIGLSPRTVVQFLPFLGYFTRCRAGGCLWQRLSLGVGRSPWAPT